MNTIEQSAVYPEVYFVKIGTVTIKLDETGVVELIRSAMKTDVGKKMLDNYTKSIKYK